MLPSSDSLLTFDRWPGGQKQTSEKVPTEIVYDDRSKVKKWGYQVASNDRRIRCVKLLLEHGQELPSWVDKEDLEEQLARHHKTAIQVVSDYLSEMREFVIKALTKRYGPVMLSMTPIEYVLTVPAVWSHAAKDATMTAAKTAGMGQTLRMISEPEAAAIYALTTLASNRVNVGEVYTVCDAGGGTVDLITYEVETTSPLTFKEIVPGSGGLCGAVFLNIRFESFIKSRIGEEAFEDMKANHSRTWDIALNYFEEKVKRNFDPQDTNNQYDSTEFMVPLLHLDDNPAIGLENGFLQLRCAEVASFFRPLVDDITGLIEAQRNEAEAAGKKVKAVILVGGFGQSEFLHNCIRKRFANLPGDDESLSSAPKKRSRRGFLDLSQSHQPTPGLEIMQSQNPWTAIIRGAVLRGIAGRDLVTSRKARKHYGCLVAPLFDPAIHREEVKYWDEIDGKFRADNQMAWFVKKGDAIKSGEAIVHGLSAKFWQRPGHHRSSLYFCEDDVPPKELSDGPFGTVNRLCTVTVDASCVPSRRWRNETNFRGMAYMRLNYDLGLQLESGRLKFDFRIGGTVYGSVQADFD